MYLVILHLKQKTQGMKQDHKVVINVKQKGSQLMTCTSFLVFASASSSEITGIALEDSEAYRFTMDISSINDEVLPDSLRIERNFFFVKDGGEPKSGPVSRGSQQ